MIIKKFIILVLASISITGIIGIPMGDPQFFAQAIGLEIVFVTLMILSIKKIRLSLIPNIIIGIVVMIGNSISSQHIEIMSSLTPLGNALILFIGGYVLQLLLISSSIVCLKNR